MIVALVFAATDTSPFEGLVVFESGEDTEDDRNASVELGSHEAMGDRVADVFKVHGGTLDEDPDGDDGVKGAV